MRFRLIDQETAQHPVSLLCNVLEVSRAGFYAWKKRGRSRRSREDERLKSLIRRSFTESRETYGAPRIHVDLSEDYGVRIGRKRVARLMRELGIEGVSRRGKRKYRTTIPAREAPAAPGLGQAPLQGPGAGPALGR
jgi:putative transposase